MKNISKYDLSKWIVNVIRRDGCHVPYVLNGGDFSWMDEEQLSFIERVQGVDFSEQDVIDLFGDDYYDDVEIVKDGEEYSDFRDCLSDDEYKSMTFIRVNHMTGYNEENMDYMIATWDLV